MFLVGVVILIVTATLWYQIKYHHRNLLLSRLPSPSQYPLIHHSVHVIGKTVYDFFQVFEGFKSELGPVFYTSGSIFDKPNITISDPIVAEGILSSQYILDKSSDYDLVKPWLGTGLLISTGKKWHSRRKIITPSFHFQILEKFVEIMDEQGKVLISKLEKLNGQQVDIFPLVNLYALDVICESAMGCKISAQINQDSEYVKAVKDISNIVFERSFDPFLQYDFFYKRSKMYQREQKNLKVLHGFTDSVIRSRRNELLERNKDFVPESSEVKKKQALLDILLQSSVDGVPLTNSDIREEVDTFMFEGHDTTTSGISFCLYNIARYPEIQQKVFEEIQNEIGDSKVLTLQLLNNLRYLELVIKESLRLFPPVPYFGRKFLEEITVGGYTIPKDCDIMMDAYGMGRNPNSFPDPLKFDPYRFDVETTTEKVNPYAYVPFSAGPRNCVGQKFAVYEMKSIICKIVKDFELSISKQNENLQVYAELVLKSVGGITLKINKRG